MQRGTGDDGERGDSGEGEGPMTEKDQGRNEDQSAGDEGQDDSVTESLDWRKKLTTTTDRLGYLKTALRYWYSKDWYGSEKRKGTSDAV